MKLKKSVFLIIMFTILFIYTTNVDKIPSNIILFQNQDYEISYMKGINIEGDSISVADNLFRNLAKVKSDYIGEDKLTLSVFGGVIKKDININVLPNTEVILGGDTVGIRLYSEGVLVIGTMPVQGQDGEYYEPYKNTKIEKGDIIKKVNDVEVETIEELVSEVNKATEDKVTIEYEKGENTIKEEIIAIKALDDNTKKLGLWVKDGVMGVGTLTFYNPENGTYAALGHGISEQEIKELIKVDTGAINLASILSIKKGEKDLPGEIRGLLNDEMKLGTINKNETSGIYGDINYLKNYFRGRESIAVASRNEIKLRTSKNCMHS